MKKANCPKKDSYKKKLSDCVFCGRDEPYLFFDDKYYFVRCERCVCRGPQSLVRKKAINAWNKRAKVKQSE